MNKELDPDWPVFEINEGEDYDNKYNLIYENPGADRDGREYEMVSQFLENEDFYQGLCKITVIRRKGDGKLFGFSWWDDISKHGQSHIESNGDEYGLECDTDVEGFDWDKDYVSYYVFEPVEEYSIPAYRKVAK